MDLEEMQQHKLNLLYFIEKLGLISVRTSDRAVDVTFGIRLFRCAHEEQ